MKTLIKIAKRLLIVIIVLNTPPISGLLVFALIDPVGIPFHFITKDLRFQQTGGVERIKKGDLYQEYIKKYPNVEPTLYRIDSRNWWIVFRWAEFLTREQWRQPYIELPADFQVNFLSDRIDDNPPYYWNEQQEKWVKTQK